jgi:hypothetical protein
MSGAPLTRRSSFLALLALAAAVALLVAPSAQAANLVPNPGFEDDCSGVPCRWINASGSTGSIARDTTTAHTGDASIRLETGGPASVTAGSACQPAGTQSLAASFWYAAPATGGPAAVQLTAQYFSARDCASGSFLGQQSPALTDASLTRDGNWHRVPATGTATFTAPTGTQGIQFQLVISCGAPCSGTANFDDVLVEGTPLAVTLSTLRAARSSRGVVVRWRTAAEIGTLGFNVYRERGQRRVRLNRRLIPALSLRRGGTSGGAYSYLDRRAPKRTALRYWLQEVEVDGTRSWHGPARVGPA